MKYLQIIKVKRQPDTKREYVLADNETIELGNDGVNRVLVNTGLETYHKNITLEAIDEEEAEKLEKEAAKVAKAELKKKEKAEVKKAEAKEEAEEAEEPAEEVKEEAPAEKAEEVKA